ncbi:TrbI/VirB10 family protein [Desulfobacter sp.]|uniref:TrbI/VirB10 family protein n=1 Tax=Desulfobacter sp. TaxID=2294 RepID=UPI003D140945
MSAPRGLQRPGVMTTVLSKKPILVLFLFIAIIVLLLLFSIFDEGKRNKKNSGQDQETLLIEPQQSSISTDEEGLNLPKAPKERKGLASETDPNTPGEKKDQKTLEPIEVVRAKPPPQDPVKAALDKQRQKQLVTVLQYRFEKQRQALESNPVVYKKDASMIVSTSAGISDQAGQHSGSSARLAELNSELANAKASLGLGGAGSQSTESITTKTGLSISSNQTPGNDSSMWDNGYSMDQDTNALSIKTGSIIPVVLITGIDSTLPGYISGQVSQNVWDTATGYNLLIPQGTKVFGQYQNNIIMGQERVFVVWQRLIFPDGRAMTLKDMPGGDQLGYAGLKDKVNNHYFRIYGHALLMSLVTGGTAYAMNTLDSDNSDETTTLNESMGTAFADQMGQTTMRLLEKHMNMSPTLSIRPGYRLNIIAVKDLEFSEPYEGKL